MNLLLKKQMALGQGKVCVLYQTQIVMAADNEDYRNSGYSRGHLAPAGDMKWDSVAMLESFYFTNCIPQDRELNNGRWNQLEMKVRTWAKEYGRVYIVCGPVFLNTDTLRIGHNKVAVPDACFKALLIPTSTSYSAIAFVMRNGEEKRNLKECSCTIDQLETLLGLDLFHNLPDRVETEVESSICWYNWGVAICLKPAETQSKNLISAVFNT